VAAGVDPGSLVEAESTWLPPSYADRRFAWEGTSPAVGGQVHVDAASYRGRPVGFRVLRKVVPEIQPATTTASRPGFWPRARELVGTTWFLLVLIGAAMVAARNLKLGRGDRDGALRFALCLGAARMLLLVGAHHIASTDEIEILKGHLAWSLYVFGLAYVFYLTLEPYARRLWPHMLVSWVRLLSGRFRDPLVGRDLLIGFAYGTTHGLVLSLAQLSSLRLGLADPPLEAGFWSVEALRGFAGALSSLAGELVNAIVFAFFGIMMFLVLRLLLRRTWAALAIWLVLAVVLFNPGSGNPWPYLISVAIVFFLFWLVFFRSGLLAVVTGLSIMFLLKSLPLTYELWAWHGQTALLVLALVLGVAVWGLWTALAGRPLFRDEIAGLATAVR
jgi:eukaryotic-like serine/threonine-protein kinase